MDLELAGYSSNSSRFYVSVSISRCMRGREGGFHACNHMHCLKICTHLRGYISMQELLAWKFTFLECENSCVM